MNAIVEHSLERTYRISAVEKAFVVLDVFSVAPHRFTLSEVSARAELSTNQTFRLLQTLVGIGYVRQQTETKIYSLGHRAFGLVPALFTADDLILASREVIDAVHSQTGEVVSLTVLEQEYSTICLYACDSADSPIIPAGIGSRSPHLHAGAVGKVFLAYQEDECVNRYLDENDPLFAYTSRTPTSREALWAAIREVRAEGVAISDGEVAIDMYGIAAPVRNRHGAVIASVTLAAPLSRSGPEVRERHRSLVVEAARRISTNLGYRAVVAFG